MGTIDHILVIGDNQNLSLIGTNIYIFLDTDIAADYCSQSLLPYLLCFRRRTETERVFSCVCADFSGFSYIWCTGLHSFSLPDSEISSTNVLQTGRKIHLSC